MAENSKIQWCDHTFNPWIGCTKVSAGCKFCYAEELMSTRYKRVEWGDAGTRSRTSDDNWQKPRRWNRYAEKMGVRLKVFCASLADVFEDRDELKPWRWDLFELIRETPHLDWLLLTKRPENVAPMLWDALASNIEDLPEPHILEVADFSDVYPNVWLGTSVEDQATTDARIPELLDVPARVHFLSCEPLLESVDLRPVWKRRILDTVLDVGIDWVIAGGESGSMARPCHVDWIRKIKNQCKEAGVPFFNKQLGALVFDQQAMAAHQVYASQCWPEGTESSDWLIKLKHKKGGDPEEWPEDLRVREFPEMG